MNSLNKLKEIERISSALNFVLNLTNHVTKSSNDLVETYRCSSIVPLSLDLREYFIELNRLNTLIMSCHPTEDSYADFKVLAKSIEVFHLERKVVLELSFPIDNEGWKKRKIEYIDPKTNVSSSITKYATPMLKEFKAKFEMLYQSSILYYDQKARKSLI